MPFFSDDFSSGSADQNLDELGWSSSTSPTQRIVSDGAGTVHRLAGVGGTPIYWNESVAPSSADYTVEADIYCDSSGNAMGVTGREDGTGANHYYGRLSTNSTTVQLLRRLSGSLSVIASGNDATSNQYQTKNVKLSMEGSAIKLYVDGVQRASVTNSQITAAGYPGLSCFNAGTSDTWDNFAATYIGGGEIDLTATNATSNATATNGALAQAHALAAQPALSQPAATDGALTQQGALQADSATSQPAVGAPALTQAHALQAENATSQPVASAPALSVVHSLGAENATSQPAASEGAVTIGGYNLIAQNASSIPAVSSPALSQTQILVAQNARSATTASEAALSIPGAMARYGRRTSTISVAAQRAGRSNIQRGSRSNVQRG